MMKSIFSKPNIESDKAILSHDDIMKTIPKSATSAKKNNFLTNVIEWRWRFFDIDGEKKIEISYLANNKRIYIDNIGNKIEYDVGDEWDKYVTNTLYAYAE
jgi:hypothetical protein